MALNARSDALALNIRVAMSGMSDGVAGIATYDGMMALSLLRSIKKGQMEVFAGDLMMTGVSGGWKHTRFKIGRLINFRGGGKCPGRLQMHFPSFPLGRFPLISLVRYVSSLHSLLSVCTFTIFCLCTGSLLRRHPFEAVKPSHSPLYNRIEF